MKTSPKAQQVASIPVRRQASDPLRDPKTGRLLPLRQRVGGAR